MRVWVSVGQLMLHLDIAGRERGPATQAEARAAIFEGAVKREAAVAGYSPESAHFSTRRRNSRRAAGWAANTARS
jgi:hypothetical protein